MEASSRGSTPVALSPPQAHCLPFSAVSNEVPEHPCVSPVSNHVYERRLIEKYIAENGTDPINNQPLSEEQLIDIKGACRLASPRGRPCPQPGRAGGGARALREGPWPVRAAEGEGGGERWSAPGYGLSHPLPSLCSCSPNPAQASFRHQHPGHSEGLAG